MYGSNIFSPFFGGGGGYGYGGGRGNVAFLTGNPGGEANQAGIAEAIDGFKVLQPDDGLGVINGGVEVFESRIPGLQGEIAVPQSVDVEDVISIVIDTSEETGYTYHDLFGRGNGAGGSCGCGEEGGLAYMGTCEDDNEMDFLMEVLMSTDYLVSMVHLYDQPLTIGALPDMNLEFEVMSRNLGGRSSGQKSFSAMDSVNPFHQVNNQMWIPIQKKNARLNKWNMWRVKNLAPNHRYTFRFHVAARRS